jgi:hypothetical protein
MDPSKMTTTKAFIIVCSLLALSLIVPAKWFGADPLQERHQGLILRDPNELALLSNDNDHNNNPDWKDLLNKTTSASTTEAAKKTVITEETKKRLADPNNLTASFSKNLYTASAYAQKNGTLSTAQQEELVSSIVQGESSKIIIKTYTLDDLTIAKKEDEATRRTYGNALGTIFKEAQKYKLDIVDVTNIQAYLTNKDPAPLASLVIKKNNAATIIEKLLILSVPYSASPYHLLLINRLSAYKTALEGLSTADADPIRATIAFKSYIPSFQLVASSIASMQIYFKVQNITFKSNESGYVLTTGYTK